jgi:hypothetical protein
MRRDDPAKMEKMRAWLAQVSDEAGVEPDLLAGLETRLLSLISDVAHGPSRPGAPLTAFLIGVAVGRGADGADLISRVQAHAAQEPDADRESPVV